MPEIQCAVDAKALLGEGTCWDPREQCLWWLDIFGLAIHRYEPTTGRTRSFRTPGRPGCLAVRQRGGGLVVAMGDGFHAFDPLSCQFQSIVDVEADIPQTRMNDGRTDRQGRFWSGSVYEVEGEPSQPLGALHRLDADLSSRKMAEGFTCFNGLAWSPDSRTLYCTDSATHEVYAWDFDPPTGEIDRQRLFVDLSAEQAVGDGATVDADGGYWLTLPFKGKVQRFDPNGKLMQTIKLPVDTPTCCEFGGRDLDILYVTTATLNRSREELKDQPWAGALLAIDAGVKGLPGAMFAG
jgi:sugar lactone lactonase YvrE